MTLVRPAPQGLTSTGTLLAIALSPLDKFPAKVCTRNIFWRKKKKKRKNTFSDILPGPSPQSLYSLDDNVSTSTHEYALREVFKSYGQRA
jgi:hypothetical protein